MKLDIELRMAFFLWIEIVLESNAIFIAMMKLFRESNRVIKGGVDHAC